MTEQEARAVLDLAELHLKSGKARTRCLGDGRTWVVEIISPTYYLWSRQDLYTYLDMVEQKYRKKVASV